MQRMSRPFFQLVFACLIGSDLYAAQAVSGTVRDVTGGAVESAEVVLVTAELTVVATTRSGGDGRFTRAELILPPEKSCRDIGLVRLSAKRRWRFAVAQRRGR